MIVTAGAAGIHIIDQDTAIPIDGGVTALVARSGELLAATGDGRILRSPDTRTWATVSVVRGPDVRCLLAVGDAVLVGTAEAALYRVEGERADRVESFDSVAGRETWFTPWGGPPDTRALASGGEAIYANVHVGGIPRSRDGGVSWEPTIDVDADVHHVVAHDATVLAPCASGLAVSTDAGATWRIDDGGLHGGYCRAVAVAEDAVLVSASTGPFTKRAALYRRPVGSDGAFERCGSGLPEWFGSNIDTHALAARGSTAAFAADGRIWRSDDAGRTWDVAADEPDSVRAVALFPAA